MDRPKRTQKNGLKPHSVRKRTLHISICAVISARKYEGTKVQWLGRILVGGVIRESSEAPPIPNPSGLIPNPSGTPLGLIPESPRGCRMNLGLSRRLQVNLGFSERRKRFGFGSGGPSLLLRAVISVELLDMRGVVRSARVGPPDYMAGSVTPKAWRISLCRASGCGSLVTVVFSSTR